MAKTFEVQYWFTCPEPVCLKRTANTIAIEADDSAGARELAIADLTCEYCQKKLPKGYFVHTSVHMIPK
jgi:aspartate carbamoyltransferase regulatory subunit